MKRLGRATLTVAIFGVLAVPGQSAVGSAYPAGTGNEGGTILFARNNHWYTIAPNGTHLHMLPTPSGCPDFGCSVFSPNGSRIMMTEQTSDKKRFTTAIINADGSGYHALPLPDRTFNLAPGAWAPNGRRIALAGGDGSHKSRNGIYAVNAFDGRRLVRLTTSPDGIDWPLEFSPDGSRLMFFDEPFHEVGFGELFETTATGSGRVKLNPPGTQVTAHFGSPGSWSPNGRKLTFTAFQTPASAGLSAVFVEDANGTHRRRISQWGQWSTSAHWSPDGTWIVFDKVEPVIGGPHRLYLVHPDGTGLKAVTTVSRVGAACCAVWSPDGKKLLFGGLKIMNRDGSRLIHLTPGDPKDETAGYAWGP